MASANVTVSPAGYEFECDTTQRLATLVSPGGKVSNTSAVDAFINVDGGTVTTTQPAGASGRSVPAGSTVVLPRTCMSFTFKTASGTAYLLYEAA